ncbi:MAG: thioredoxin domain-containing protein [Devosiaceae bacterium]|nr:thioredoxin domain-containing protein [Devosiaceae bacterium MH13]
MRPTVIAVALSALIAPVAAGLFVLQSSSSPPAQMEPTAATASDAEEIASAPPIDLLAPGTPPDAPSALADLVAADPQAARDLVRSALLAEPEMLEEAIAALEASREAQAEAERTLSLMEQREALLDVSHAAVLGNPEGTITLVEFLDYNCGFCKRAHGDVLRLIEAEPNLRVLVRDFPVLGPESLEAAQVAIAFRQAGGDMAAFIDRMMRETDRRADAVFAREVALSLGADEATLDAGINDQAALEAVGATYAIADALSIRGTPAFIVGDELLMGAVGFDRLMQAVHAQGTQLPER